MPPSSSPALPLNVSASGAPSKSPAPASAAAAVSSAKATTTSDISSPHELTAFVETLLEQLDAKFDDMSSQILDRMMQMSTRVDALEAAIQDIINGDTAPGPPSMPQSPALAQRRSGGV
ncbi:heat shock factor binding protein 1-domain-containing protein [Rhodofomes roseus]|uniref:Heat shock factor binding protein 1-domain-containing protein n=1 Tax=Rhodofomes roseus TaxID=34475 RepID=A0A4Y9YRV5_9APHY|nr:heat shock factor binding protein 1-domain-containing protein [Rhodofomes roseus]KAH9838440.1 heat shock factor binding protein 1-domain-containing protein [Rhodofomes roseus]TFY64902.1 hypothetical protein EVJ58_g2317 [Rhodofomes roseus]